MTCVEIDFIVISLLHWKMQQQLVGEDILINPDEIWDWRRPIECATGLAISNAFQWDDIEKFLRYGKERDLFQPLKDEKNNFKFDKNKLSRMSAWPNASACLMDFFDPRLNYPMEVIEASGLIPVLESKD